MLIPIKISYTTGDEGMRDIILYSGGKESLLTLKDSVDHGEDPTILHFKTLKLSNLSEKRVKENARRIYRTDAYYTYETQTQNYIASYTHLGDYWVKLTKGDDAEYKRLDTLGRLHIGYWKLDNPTMKEGVETLGEVYPNKYEFPLADHTENQILKEWKKLPDKVRQNTYTSTLLYWRKEFHEGHVVKPGSDTEGEYIPK